MAGQVLHRELYLKGIPSRLTDKTAFPRDKVCGGALQWDSWEYLNSIFDIKEKAQTLRTINHFWRGKRISRVHLNMPMVYVSRYVLDDALNRQQEGMQAGSQESIRVLAGGVSHPKGNWLGFQGPAEPVDELEMHYGRGIYLGISPTGGEKSHAAFIMKKSLFKNTESVRSYIKKELKLNIEGPLKGTKAIDYRASFSRELAVGDAKLTTHSFLGLGMKHAILSARLMARLIASDRVKDYSALHRCLFRKYRIASWLAGTIYDSPLRLALRPVLGNPALFLSAYRWLHEPDPAHGMTLQAIL